MYKNPNILIVINSSNRVGKVKTHLLFPNDHIQWVIAVPHTQAPEYTKEYGTDKIWVIDDTVKPYLPSQRQHMMESAGNFYPYIWFMDDDLTFFKRDSELKLSKCTESDIENMFETMQTHLDEIPMVGISTRLGNNRIETDYDEINRVTRCYALNSEVFKKVGATFAPFEPFTAEDFHMALCFLNAGYKNRIIHTYAQEDIGSNAEGGCSLYRTSDVQRKTSFWMTENHPEVSVKAKKSGNWKGFGEYRVDMIVQWKKAFKDKTIQKVKPSSPFFKRISKK